jgi:glutamate-ammonia-ligase adenylyltransferase
VASFEKYQSNAAWVWEHQALTRARYCAGDAAIGQRFEQIREAVLRKERPADGPLKPEVIAMRKRMMDAKPNHSALFDLKQDPGGMIDIEFIVQFLVLQHAHIYPELTANFGNIALLRICAELGLIDGPLAASVADAYRKYRKLQHQLRLQGQENARVAPELVTEQAATVRLLWDSLFGERVAD